MFSRFFPSKTPPTERQEDALLQPSPSTTVNVPLSAAFNDFLSSAAPRTPSTGASVEGQRPLPKSQSSFSSSTLLESRQPLDRPLVSDIGSREVSFGGEPPSSWSKRSSIPSSVAEPPMAVNQALSAAFNQFLVSAASPTARASATLGGLNESQPIRSSLTKEQGDPQSEGDFDDGMVHEGSIDMMLHDYSALLPRPATELPKEPRRFNHVDKSRENLVWRELLRECETVEGVDRESLLSEGQELLRHLWVSMQSERQHLRQVMSTQEALDLLGRIRRERVSLEDSVEHRLLYPRLRSQRGERTLTTEEAATPPHSTPLPSNDSSMLHTRFFTSTTIMPKSPLKQATPTTSPSTITPLSKQREAALAARGRLAAPPPPEQLVVAANTTALNSAQGTGDAHLASPASEARINVGETVKAMLDEREGDFDKLHRIIQDLEANNGRLQGALAFEQRRSEGLFHKAQLLQRKLHSVRQEGLLWRAREREKMRLAMSDVEMRLEQMASMRGGGKNAFSPSNLNVNVHRESSNVDRDTLSQSNHSVQAMMPRSVSHPTQLPPHHQRHGRSQHHHTSTHLTTNNHRGEFADLCRDVEARKYMHNREWFDDSMSHQQGQSMNVSVTADPLSSKGTSRRPSSVAPTTTPRLSLNEEDPDLAALNLFLIEKSEDPGACALLQQSPQQKGTLLMTTAAFEGADSRSQYTQQWQFAISLTREYYKSKLEDVSSSTAEIKSRLADAEIELRFKEGALAMKENEILSLKSALAAFQQLSDEAIRKLKVEAAK